MEIDTVPRTFVCISHNSWGKGKTAEVALKNCKVNLPGYARQALLQIVDGSHDYGKVHVNDLGGLVHPVGMEIIDVGSITLSHGGRIHITDKLKKVRAD